MIRLALAALLGGVAVEQGTMKLADGTRLAHTLVRPTEAAGPLPVVLVRTPYGQPAALDAAKGLAERGCAVVVQDTRGRGDSGGVWTPFANERADGAEVFDWVVKQPWCNGKVGTYGMSYLGITQWQLAPHAGDRLDAMVVQFASADLFRDVVHFGGVQGLAISLSWSLTMQGGAGMTAKFAHLPLIEADDATGKDVPAWNDWCRHPVLDDYWKPLDYRERYAGVKAPALLVAGWYDLFLPGQVDDYVQLSKRAGAPEESFVRLIVGPWDHGGAALKEGRPDLGPDAFVAPADEERRFLDRFLLGVDNGYEQKAGVRAFFLGENAWEELAAWPPPGAEPLSLFLHSRGGAGGKPGDGVLMAGRPPRRDEPADAFTYDPKDPCPSYASNLWVPLSALRDQAAIGARPDVLTYATLPLSGDVRIAGPVELALWITTDAADTDFAAKLVDIAPDGKVEWRGEGIQRGRARGGPYELKLLEPTTPALLTVRMGHVAALFGAGHRIGLQVTSSNFPRFARNLNTAEPSGLAREAIVARQQVLHDVAHPSALKLWATRIAEADAGR